MKRYKHILIVGAGGASSYLVQPLYKTFTPEKLSVMDGDVLEERNLNRQLFPSAKVGWNKAKALLSEMRIPKQSKNAIPHFLPDDPHTCDWFRSLEGTDAIFCCVDNRRARRNVFELARSFQCPVFMSGNEYLTAMAYLYDPRARFSVDPLKRFPEIANTEEEPDDPFACEGMEAEEKAPQLAASNMASVALSLQLAVLYADFIGTFMADNGIPEEEENRLFESNSIPFMDSDSSHDIAYLPVEMWNNFGGSESRTFGQVFELCEERKEPLPGAPPENEDWMEVPDQQYREHFRIYSRVTEGTD